MRRYEKRWVTSILLGLTLAVLPVISGNAAVTDAKQETAAENTSMARWELREDGWYYYGADGELARGWTLVNDKYFYLTETGRCLQNTVTPDGYYVNPDGAWQVRETTILENQFTAPEKVRSVNDAWTGTETMKSLQKLIQENFKNRRIRITDSAMEYLNEDTVLIGIYKNTSTGGFRIDIRTTLDKSSTETDKVQTYDYAVFRAFLYQITTTPDYLEDAVYSSWQEDNRWKISRNQKTMVGDSEVRYGAGAGCGYYYIYPAGQK